MERSRWAPAALLAGTLALGACNGGAPEPPVPAGAPAQGVTLSLSGAAELAPLAAQIGRRFAGLHPGLAVSVQPGDSAAGVAAARSGAIGLVARDLADAEADLLPFPVARDGLTLLVHPDNPLRDLTDDQVRGLLTGRVTRWREMGGADAPVTLVAPPEGDPIRALIAGHFGLKPGEIRPGREVLDAAAALQAVAADPHALAFGSVAAAATAGAGGAAVRALALDGISPDPKAIADSRFPLVRTLSLVTNTPPTGWVKALIDYTQSGAVDDLIRARHFVPAG